MEVIEDLIAKFVPHIDEIMEETYKDEFKHVSDLAKNIPRYVVSKHSIKLFVGSNFVNVSNAIKDSIEDYDIQMRTYFHSVINVISNKRHPLAEIIKVNTPRLRANVKFDINISSYVENGITYIHPKYILLKKFEDICNPSITDDIDFMPELKKWKELDGHDFKIIVGGVEEPELIIDDEILDCPYSRNTYVGTRKHIQALMGILNADKNKEFGAVSIFNYRMEFVKFFKDGKTLGKLWLTMEKELLAIEPSGDLHIDCVVRHALADYVDAEMGLNVPDHILKTQLKKFFDIFSKRAIKIKNGTYVDKSKCKFMGVNYPHEKEIKQKRLENISAKQNA